MPNRPEKYAIEDSWENIDADVLLTIYSLRANGFKIFKPLIKTTSIILHNTANKATKHKYLLKREISFSLKYFNEIIAYELNFFLETNPYPTKKTNKIDNIKNKDGIKFAD